jgi:hypothetical protein
MIFSLHKIAGASLLHIYFPISIQFPDDEFDDVGDSRRRDNGAEKANGKEGMEEKNDTRLAHAPGSPANSRRT